MAMQAANSPYKIVMVDIDGTMVADGASGPSPAVLRALQALRQRGVVVAISTGRSPCHFGTGFLGGYTPDYGICCNGACVCRSDGTLLHAQRLAQGDVDAALAMGQADSLCLGLTFEDGYFLYYGEEYHRDLYVQFHGSEAGYDVLVDKTRHLKNRPFSCFGHFRPGTVAAFTAARPHLRMIPFSDTGHDIVQARIHKAVGAKQLLDALGLEWRHAVALGDGINDVELLRAVGMGVAMGNASTDALAAADMVTDTAAEDGVATALARLFGM